MLHAMRGPCQKRILRKQLWYRFVVAISANNISRRGLLAAGGAVAAGTQIGGRIRIAFLGVTHSHGDAKWKMVRDSPEFDLVGVAETDPDAVERLRKAGVRLLTREQLLQDSTIAVVAVESENREHGRDGLAALRAGKHVHLEKPPSVKLTDLRAIAEEAKGRERILQVGYMWRHHPGIQLALEAARKGWLGAVYQVRGVIGNTLEPSRRKGWAEFAGGVVFELGGHVLDPMVRLMGKPRRITPTLRKHGAYADELRDNGVVVMEWENAMGVLECSNLETGSGRHRTFEIRGTKGNAKVNPIEPGGLEIELSEPAGPYGKGVQMVILPAYRRYEADFVELAAAVRGTGRIGVTMDEELMVHETLLAASGML